MATATALPAPRTYDELARDWSGYIARVAANRGIAADDVDDMVQTTFEYFLVNDMLSAYDPARASFATFLSSYVAKRCYSWRRTRYNEVGALTQLDADRGEGLKLVDIIPSNDLALITTVIGSDLWAFDGWLAQRPYAYRARRLLHSLVVELREYDEVHYLRVTRRILEWEDLGVGDAATLKPAQLMSRSKTWYVEPLGLLRHLMGVWGYGA